MIPDYQTLMRPVLAFLADGEVRATREVKEAMADAFSLTAEERAELLSSGRQRVIDSRAGWAITYLTQAGLVSKPKRGQVVITTSGRHALQDYPHSITSKDLEQFPAFMDFITRSRKKPSERSDSSAALPNQPEATPIGDHLSTPLDLAEQAIATNRAAVEAEVLQAALNLTPYAFEDLVIRLLGAMGYGKSGMLERTSASGDAGIDGIISQDPLGLDRIYVQAKRYATDNPVDRPRIHEFAGALLGKQGDRGVFITTSKFTKGAREEAERINARIELIDGDRLAELLVKYRVGTQEEFTVTLYRLDEDFFDTL